jgi:cell division protein FtsL
MEKIVLGLIFVIFVLLLFYIYVANDTSIAGIDLGKIQQAVRTAQKENMILKQQLYTYESYINIASQAAAMGFVPAKQVIYLH